MRGKFLNSYWKYYLALEEDFIKSLRYVTLDTANFSSFSTEYTKQYQAICSEIDVTCKEICGIIKIGSKPSNITQYAKIILDDMSNITNESVTLKNYTSISLSPWSQWKLEKDGIPYQSPSWWNSYNNVKHDRNTYFNEANLENVLNALAGLYILEIYCYDRIEDSKGSSQYPPYPIPRSGLFTLNNWKINMEKLLLDELEPEIKNLIIEYMIKSL